MVSDKGHIWRCILSVFQLKRNIAEAGETIPRSLAKVLVKIENERFPESERDFNLKDGRSAPSDLEKFGRRGTERRNSDSLQHFYSKFERPLALL